MPVRTILNTIFATLIVAGSPGAAFAVDELSYNYVEAVYLVGETKTSGQEVDFTRLGGTVSYELTENFALFGNGFTGEVETTDIGAPKDIDTRNLAAGLTAHFPLTDNMDLVIPVAIAYARARAGSSIDSDTGYSIAVGVRSLLNERIELEGSLQRIDIGDDEHSLTGSVRYHFSEFISLALSASAGDETDSVGIGARYSF